MSYNNQMKFNLHSYSKRSYEADRWYKIDALLDWSDETAAFFVDGEYVANTIFYSQERDLQKSCDQRFINAILLYSLTPGMTSTFKEIRLCTDLCPGT